jgi:lysozyme
VNTLTDNKLNTAKAILIDMIKLFEGCRLTAYPDPGTGKAPWTIGYGQTGSGIKEGTVWTRAQAEAALNATVSLVVESALKASPELVKASPNRIAAISDFIYNCGLGSYKKSTLKKYVDSGYWEHASMEIIKWNKGGGKVLPGLVRRRQAEAELLKS